VGNPVLVSKSEKIQVEADYRGPSGLDYIRTYRGRSGRFTTTQERRLFDLTSRSSLDDCLPAMYDHPQQTGPVQREHCFRYVGIGSAQVRLQDATGGNLVASTAASAPALPTYARERMAQATDAQGATVWHVWREDNHLEVYAASGRIRKRVRHDGRAHTAGDLGNGVTTWSDTFGRSLRWERGTTGRVTRMTDPAGAVYDYSYDNKLNLSGVRYPGTTLDRQYHYETVYYGGTNTVPLHQLTGITDELGHRYATYVYGPGNQVSSERHHAGGGVDVNHYTFASHPKTVTDPNGHQRTYHFGSIQSARQVLTGISQPAGAGTAAATSSYAYDTQGNLTSRDDHNGKRACYANDLSRNLETVRVEGLNAGASCSVTAANASLPTGSRKVSTQWHPDWRLETRVAEPGRITTTVYNGQPDPFNGNAVASCAPAGALLPDGKPIAVICKRVEQATTDTNGAQGFNATLQAGVPNRVTSWTYNQHGQALTERDPLNRQTTYAYYADTAFSGSDPYAVGHTMGDLQSITNAKGQVTQYTQYDKHGNVLQSVDPNGVVTQNTYDLRQRLLSSTTAGQTTSYQYDAAGQLKRVTLADQSWIGYDYDDARRQVAVYDHKGNRTEYQLDNAGNRIGEQTKDPSGALKRQLARSIDALGRVQQTTGRE
jgi:YD repeat-containing protein